MSKYRMTCWLPGVVLALALPAATVAERNVAGLSRVQHWSAADGLPTETIGGLAIDALGQLWIATYDGVVRYDGFDFRRFGVGGQPELPSNRVVAVYAAPDEGVVVHFEHGRLGHLNGTAYTELGSAQARHVAGSAKGVWFIDAASGELRSWPGDQVPACPRECTPGAIAWDRYGERLLLGTLSGEVVALAPEPDALPASLVAGDAPVLGIAAAPAGELLVLNREGAQAYRPGEGAAQSLDGFRWQQPQAHPLAAGWVGGDWLVANLAGPSGRRAHRLGAGTAKVVPLEEPGVAGVDRSPATLQREGPGGEQWSSDGLHLFQDGQLLFGNGERIIDFVVDGYGQVWLAQPQRGLQLLRESHIETLGRGPGQLPDPNIYTVAADGEDLLIGNWMGLVRYTPATDQWARLHDQQVSDVLRTERGLLLASDTLCLLRTVGDCRAIDDFPGQGIPLLMLYQDSSGALWVGTEAGLYRRDATGLWSPAPLHSALARTVLETADGQLVFGTRGQGLLVTAVKTTASGRGFRAIGTREGLASGFVRALLALPGQRLLAGTEDAGLCLLSAALDVQRCISRAGGLPHHSVHTLLRDEAGRIWVNSNGGVYRVAQGKLLALYDGAANRLAGVTHFGEGHGLLSIEGNGGVHRAGAITPDGRIWLPNQKGLVSINPTLARAAPARPLVPRIRAADATAALPAHLPATARNLRLRLSAISLAEPDNVQFRYRFASASAWSSLGTQRDLAFRELPPGGHRLLVEARHPGASWSNEPAELHFSAGYQLHEHPAVHLLLLGAAIIGALALRRRWLRLQRSGERARQQLDDAIVRVSELDSSLRRSDARHQSSLRGVAGELKAALAALLGPALTQSSQDSGTKWPAAGWQNPESLENLKSRRALLEKLVDRIDDFTQAPPPAVKREPVQQNDNQNDDRGQATHELEALIRMEVMLHLAEPDFSVASLAQRLGMSRSVLYRRIGDELAMRPAELIRNIRIEHAARLLTETDDTVSAIADASGFRSLSSFSRAFTQQMGVSPSHWRKTH